VARRSGSGARRSTPVAPRGGPGRLVIDQAGLLRGARYIESPNCDDRPPAAEISLLVIHGISLPPGKFGGDGVLRLFTNTLDWAKHPFYETLRGLRVSAHFFVRRTGEIIQFVPCGRRAWHAGQSNWRGRGQCNDFSIGVELEGVDTRPYTERQYARLVRLGATLRRRYPIVEIVGHSDIAPGRKTDPGPAFDWGRLRTLAGRAPRPR
jgi:AmpD protein